MQTNIWIPVSERLPDPKKDVVVWTIQGNEPRYFVAALFPYKTAGYVWIGEEEIHLYPEQVLYWMPLPDPPGEDEQKIDEQWEVLDYDADWYDGLKGTIIRCPDCRFIHTLPRGAETYLFCPKCGKKLGYPEPPEEVIE